MMELDVGSRLEFQTIQLQTAQSVLLFSCIVQKSVVHLDLSACEYSLNIISVFTEEDCKKEFEPRRETLYRLHLDLPRDTERRIRVIMPDPDQGIQYETLSVRERVYNNNFASPILNSILHAENQIEAVRRYFNVMKILKLHKDNLTAVYLFDNIIPLLHPECTDSELIAEFALTFRFTFWILNHDDPEVLGYILQHSQRMGRNIQQMFEPGVDIVTSCMFFGSVRNACKLLEYGTIIPSEYPLLIYSPVGGDDMYDTLHIAYRRLHLLFQYGWLYIDNKKSWEAISYVWRSIPDPYLQKCEMFSAFLDFGTIYTEPTDPTDFLLEMIRNYKKSFVEEDSSDVVMPRALKHLCRVTIRSILSRNNQLPQGIGQIMLPRVLQDYIKLAH